MLSLLFISYLSNKVVCTKCWMSIFYCSEEARTSTQRQWHRQRVWLGELFVCVCELFVNKVLKTVLHLSLLIIGPTVALMLAHRWPTGGPTGMPHATVGPTLAHWPKWRWPTGGPTLGHRWPNSGMPLLGQRWPTGQNDVGPPVAANGGPTAEPPVAQRWATGVVLSGNMWLFTPIGIWDPCDSNYPPPLAPMWREVVLAALVLHRREESKVFFWGGYPPPPTAPAWCGQNVNKTVKRIENSHFLRKLRV